MKSWNDNGKKFIAAMKCSVKPGNANEQVQSVMH